MIVIIVLMNRYVMIVLCLMTECSCNKEYCNVDDKNRGDDDTCGPFLRLSHCDNDNSNYNYIRHEFSVIFLLTLIVIIVMILTMSYY